MLAPVEGPVGFRGPFRGFPFALPAQAGASILFLGRVLQKISFAIAFWQIFQDLRSVLSVSQPLRSVGILPLSPALRALNNTRLPWSVPCSNAVPSDIQHYGNSHLKRSQTNGNQTNRTPDLLDIFILYFRARFFPEAPFAEVLSGLLWTA